jgi:hypothetical protein
MLAIYILETNFMDVKAEWDMISSKAKKWIRQQNLDADRKKRLDSKAKALSQEDAEMKELEAMMAM